MECEVTLTEYLLSLARIWTEESGRGLGALGAQVANDGKFFDRLQAGTKISVATFERFLCFFRDEGNWPAAIPQTGTDILSALENIATGQSESSDSSSENIGRAA